MGNQCHKWLIRLPKYGLYISEVDMVCYVIEMKFTESQIQIQYLNDIDVFKLCNLYLKRITGEAMGGVQVV